MLIGNQGLVNLRTLSREEKEAVRRKAEAYFQEGYGYKATSTLLGISMYTVRDWLREYKSGIFRPSYRENAIRNTKNVEEIRSRVIADRALGLSYQELMKKHGASRTNIRAWCAQAEAEKSQSE